MKYSFVIWFLWVVMFFQGCSNLEKPKPFNLECNNYFMLKGSFGLLLASIDPKDYSLKKNWQIYPKNQVIFAANYNCENGVLTYLTQDKNVVSNRSILHVVYANHVDEYVFEQGAVTLLPYGKDEIIVGTQLLKREPYNKYLGETDAFEYIGFSSGMSEEVLTGKHETMFTESVIFNLKTKSIRKYVNGHERVRFHDGRYILYTNLSRVVEFFPETGQRKVLIRHGAEDISDKNFSFRVIYRGEYFYVKDQFLMVNSEVNPSDVNPEFKSLPYNSIHRFSPEKGWQTIESFKSSDLVGFLSGGRLFALAGQDASVYNPEGQALVRYSIPVSDARWMGGSLMHDGNTLALVGLNNNKVFLYVMPADFSRVLARVELQGFNGQSRLYTHFVQDPVWNNGL